MCMLIEEKNTKRIFSIILTSFLLETMQYILHIGASDITDLITNTFGGILGILLFEMFYKILKEKTYKIINIISIIATILLLLLIVTLIVANL